MYFDTHAHYDDAAFGPDRDELLGTLLPRSGVELVVNPGCNAESSRMAVQLAERYHYFYAAVGFHPSDAADFTEESAALLRELAGHPKVQAIGEIGLDYYHGADTVAAQQRCFRRQLELARELGKPVIVHDREAHKDCLDILAEYPDVRGVFHCYSGSAEMAKELVRRGWHLSFTGAITFKNARRVPEVIAAVPPEKIMIETDAPYLAPVPHRGRRNDSTKLPLIAGRIAEILGTTLEEVAALTLENGKRFFGI